MKTPDWGQGIGDIGQLLMMMKLMSQMGGPKEQPGSPLQGMGTGGMGAGQGMPPEQLQAPRPGAASMSPPQQGVGGAFGTQMPPMDPQMIQMLIQMLMQRQ